MANALMAQLGLKAEQGDLVVGIGTLDKDNKVAEATVVPKLFPINGPNVYTLNNVPGHFVYSGDSPSIERALEAERAAVVREIHATKARLLKAKIASGEGPGEAV